MMGCMHVGGTWKRRRKVRKAGLRAKQPAKESESPACSRPFDLAYAEIVGVGSAAKAGVPVPQPRRVLSSAGIAREAGFFFHRQDWECARDAMGSFGPRPSLANLDGCFEDGADGEKAPQLVFRN